MSLNSNEDDIEVVDNDGGGELVVGKENPCDLWCCVGCPVRYLFMAVYYAFCLLFHEIENVTVASMLVFLDGALDENFQSSKVAVTGSIVAVSVILSLLKTWVKDIALEKEDTMSVVVRDFFRAKKFSRWVFVGVWGDEEPSLNSLE